MSVSSVVLPGDELVTTETVSLGPGTRRDKQGTAYSTVAGVVRCRTGQKSDKLWVDYNSKRVWKTLYIIQYAVSYWGNSGRTFSVISSVCSDEGRESVGCDSEDRQSTQGGYWDCSVGLSTWTGFPGSHAQEQTITAGLHVHNADLDADRHTAWPL